MLRLRGGAKKRKKKVYTTPKKIKHKRKKTKLAVLKYYKVDGDGKIERLRRECPQEQVSNIPTLLDDAHSADHPIVRCRCLHGCHAQPPVLRQVPPHLRLRRVQVNVSLASRAEKGRYHGLTISAGTLKSSSAFRRRNEWKLSCQHSFRT